MSSTTYRIPSCSASSRPSRSASSDESRSGSSSPNTRSAPSARVARVATTELSTPPDIATTTPRRRRSPRTMDRICASIPSASRRGSIWRASRENMRWLPSARPQHHRIRLGGSSVSVWIASLRHNGQDTGRRLGLGIEQGAPPGVNEGPGLPPTPFLADWLAFHAERRPDAPCVVAGEIRLTYGDVAGRVRALAADLSRRGVVSGTRVLLALPNSPATIVAGLAINLLGATSVEVSRSWTAEVLGDVVARAGTRHLIVAARDAATWERALAGRAVEHAWVVHRELPRTGAGTSRLRSGHRGARGWRDRRAQRVRGRGPP